MQISVFCIMRVFLAFLLPVLFSSCGVVDKLTTFEIDYTVNVEIPEDNVITLPLDIISPRKQTESNVKFQNNDTRADLIENITLKTLTLTIESPENGNFDFLESIQIFIQSDGLPEVEVANRSSVPNGSMTLNLETFDGDLSEYVKAESFNIRVKVFQDDSIDETLDVRSDLTFKVKAQLLN